MVDQMKIGGIVAISAMLDVPVDDLEIGQDIPWRAQGASLKILEAYLLRQVDLSDSAQQLDVMELKGYLTRDERRYAEDFIGEKLGRSSNPTKKLRRGAQTDFSNAVR